MSGRDYRRHEPKKPKKDAKKLPPVITILPTPVEVEVIKKGKKAREVGEEEEQ